MQANHRPFIQYTVLVLWLLLGLSYTLSPALISIAFTGICVLGLWSFKSFSFDRYNRGLFILFLAFYFITFLSAFYSTNTEEAVRKLILKLPLLFFPLFVMALRGLSAKHCFYLAISLLYSLYVPALVSVYNYLLNKKLFDQLILESKPLPIEFGYGIYHIQFSILLAASVLFGIYLILKRQVFQIEKYRLLLLSFLVLANVVFLHILSARTGLLSLYAGLAVIALKELRHLSFKSRLRGALAVVFFIAGILVFSSSLRNRIKNTTRDIQVVWQGEDANDYSFALRVQAWKNALSLIKKHPLAGVGIGDAEKKLYAHFAQVNPRIEPINRKNPHFQLLETSVQSGIPAGILLLLISVYLIKTISNKQYILAGCGILLLTASCFESILERQVSVVGFSALIALAYRFAQETQVQPSTEVSTPVS